MRPAARAHTTARETVARYRWENVAASVLDVYEALTAGETELAAAGV